MKTHWTKEEVITELERASKSHGITQDLIELVMYVERLFYNKHTDDIRKRQDKLEYLYQDDNRFVAFWVGGKYKDEALYRDIFELISPGCNACLTAPITHVRHSTKCTQNCSFCYHRYKKLGIIGKGLYQFSGHTMSYTLDEAKLLATRQLVRGGRFPYQAVGWLQREPLEEAESIYPLMEHISNLGVHQYLYTNGVKATKDVIDRLARCGLREIRYNLVASDFSDLVIDSMAYAKTTIPWVLIETPIFSKTFKWFVEKCKDVIYYTGLNQINMPELQICYLETLPEFVRTEGPVYKHRRGYVSPISSRHYAYDVIELAEKEDWPVIINDCSNDTKFYRGSSPMSSLGYVDYPSVLELPFDHVAYLADQVLEEGVTYEFF